MVYLVAMYCRRCGYALWNLPEPRCPECGLEFDLTSYRYQPGTVAFACGACGHRHQQVGESLSTPLPASIFCRICAKEYPASRFQVVPLTANAQAYADEMLPWETDFPSTWKAFRGTFILGISQPHHLGRRARMKTTFGRALIFAWCIHIPLYAVQVLSVCVLMFGVSLAQSLNSAFNAVLSMAGFLLMISFLLLLGVMQPLLVTLFIGMPSHLVLRMTGDTSGPLSRTLCTILYCQSPLLFGALPCIGLHLNLIWWPWMLVSSIIALHHSQQVHPLRASVAILLPGLLVFMGCCGCMFLR